MTGLHLEALHDAAAMFGSEVIQVNFSFPINKIIN